MNSPSWTAKNATLVALFATLATFAMIAAIAQGAMFSSYPWLCFRVVLAVVGITTYLVKYHKTKNRNHLAYAGLWLLLLGTCINDIFDKKRNNETQRALLQMEKTTSKRR